MKNFISVKDAADINALVAKALAYKANPFADKTASLDAPNAEEQKQKQNKADQQNYNVKQSKIAIGSGGFFGKGFLKGTQTSSILILSLHPLVKTLAFWAAAC